MSMTYAKCPAGSHDMTLANTTYPTGTPQCVACHRNAEARRVARIKVRMRQLLVGFRYSPRGPWQNRAECRTVRSPIFLAVDRHEVPAGSSVDAVNRQRHAEARRYCERCPVVAQCLGEALTMRKEGTHGGELLTPSDWKEAAPIVRELEKQK